MAQEVAVTLFPAAAVQAAAVVVMVAWVTITAQQMVELVGLLAAVAVAVIHQTSTKVKMVAVRQALFVSFGLEVLDLLGHSHQLTRVICNGTLHSHHGWATI